MLTIRPVRHCASLVARAIHSHVVYAHWLQRILLSEAIYGDCKVTKLDACFFLLLLFLFLWQLKGLIFYDNQSNRYIPVTEKQMFEPKKEKKKKEGKQQTQRPGGVGPEHMAWTLQAAELHLIEFDMPPDNRAAVIWLVCCVSSRDVHCEIIEDEVLQPLVISSGIAQSRQRRPFW